SNEKLSPACAIIEDNLVYCLNQEAHQRGVRIGQNVTSAFAFCDHLQLIERNKYQEAQQLQNLAILLYQVSSSIKIQQPQWRENLSIQQALLSLEIGRSLQLYRGINNLIDVVSLLLIEEPVEFQLGIGHSEKSARLLSHYPLASSLQSIPSIEAKELDNNPQAKIDFELVNKQLEKIPVELMEIDYKSIEKIQSVGFKTIGELAHLPESAIRKRFGVDTYRYLMQLFAKLADPEDYFVPPESFYQKVEFIDVVHHRQGLLFPIKRLTQQLCQFLRLKQKSCQSLYWELFDSEKNTIGFEILISESLIDSKVYIELTQLNLERYTLHAPIEAIALTANKLNELTSESKSLFEDSGDFKQDNHFIHKIRAKLGNNSCYQIAQRQEHVPELASSYSMEINDSRLVQEASHHKYISLSLALDINQQTSRPAWLFEKPKPIQFNQRKLLWKGELQIISSQEKITSYWWKKNVARDYFLAEHQDGTIYWVFFDQEKRQWFLHGIYG
ncbi:MAG: DNA polymerase Y family protein, partial [Kangiellaceae bacterium]|nr:DNA polymerase Y family protein [Kangiellaceae bacterium]